jgi:choice-of-anchor B domain-containing protein
MKKPLLIILFAALTAPVFAQFAHNNISLLGQFDDPSVLEESVYHIRYQGCWGWKNPADGREYAIIGSTFGTYFIEVTDPSNPVERDYVAGAHQYCIWHEYKSYGKYCYILSDDNPNTFQIADMSYLPDSVHVVYDGTTLFNHGHTLYIDGDKLYVGIPRGTSAQNHQMAVYSLANPELPVFLRGLEQDYPSVDNVHDMYVVNDTVYASESYDGLRIYRYNIATNRFIQLGALTPEFSNDYNHSSFLSKDRKTLYMCIEVPAGRPVQVVDVSNIASPSVVTTFNTNAGCTPHNPYVIDDLFVLAAYNDGVYAYNIEAPHNPVLSGYFDTHPQNGNTYPQAYAGCWGAFPDLPSGILLASDMQYGLFILDKTQALGIPQNNIGNLSLVVYPNPSKGFINVQVNGINETIHVSVTSLDGKVVFESSFEPSALSAHQIDTKDFAAGLYMVKAVTGSKSVTRRISVVK